MTRRSPSHPPTDPDAADDLRDRLTDVVHELRAPTAIAMGLVERLGRSAALLPDARRDIDRLAVNLRMLETHVRSLSAGVRIDGTARVAQDDLTPRDVAVAFRRTAEDLVPIAAERGVRLSVAAPRRLDVPVDPRHLLVVLSNLLVNAIRATPRDGTVHCALTFDGVLRVTVADSGPGIPVEDRPRALERFGRATDGADGAAPGLGLGLEIVGRIARRYEGWVQIGDAPQGGALVTVGLPLGPVQRLATPPTPTAAAVVRALAPTGVDADAGRPLVLVVGDGEPAAALAAALGDGGRRAVVVVPPDALGSPGPAVDVAVLPLPAGGPPAAALASLRSASADAELPVVALVAADDVALRLEVLALGADDLAEPTIAAEELCGRVDRQIARRRRDEQRRAGAARFRGAFRDAAVGLGLVTIEGAWQAVNPALCAITGLAEHAMLRGRLDDLDHPEDHGSEAAPLRELLRGRTRGFQLDKRWVTGPGEVVWVRLSVSAERDAVGAPSGLVVQVEDVTDARTREGRLEHSAGHDRLTGLLARAGIEVELRRLVVLAREGGPPGAVVAVALDDLGGINRRFGQHAGDHALHLVARVLEDAVRRTDVVGRTAGDGFALLLQEIAPEDVDALVAQLASVVREHPLVVDGAVVPVSAVFGRAPLDGSETAAAVLRRAEGAVAAQRRTVGYEPAPLPRRRRPRSTGRPDA